MMFVCTTPAYVKTYSRTSGLHMYVVRLIYFIYNIKKILHIFILINILAYYNASVIVENETVIVGLALCIDLSPSDPVW
jgi:hypothetical protein